jgi:hypothetical protein
MYGGKAADAAADEHDLIRGEGTIMGASGEERSTASRRSPPDYTKRSLKLRIFAYLAVLMLILSVWERSREPANWDWLWSSARNSAEQVNPRLGPQELRTAHDPPGTFVSAASPKWETGAGDKADLAESAWEQAWNDVLARLSPDQRSLVFELLYKARHLHNEPAEDAAALAGALNTAWDQFETSAARSLEELPEEERAKWLTAIVHATARFRESVLPAIREQTEGANLMQDQQRALASLEQTLVKLSLQQVTDDTVFRPAERDIWFYELARARELSPGVAAGSAAPQRVSYVQLFRQSKDYRGKAVTIRGTARLGYRVPAPANYLGIKEYFVFTIHPAGGPDSPILVYSLEAPPGFARINLRDEGGTKLREDIETAGIFFKRLAYPSRDGDYTAPLIVAARPHWLRPVENARPALGPMEFSAIALGTLLLALCITAVLWKRTGRSRPANRADSHYARLPPGLTLGPSTAESLKQLEKQANAAAD